MLRLIVTLALGLVLTAGAAAWGVARLSRNLTASLAAYDMLRQLYDVGMELTRIGDASDAQLRLVAVTRQVDRINDPVVRWHLLARLTDATTSPARRINGGLNTVMGAVADAKGRIRALEDDARRQRRTTLAAMGVFSVATLTIVGLMVRGQLRTLDDQVRSKSAELARAERLASVGFLAAGVAHELNTPLAIISGEAELALRRGGLDNSMAVALHTMRDEAFRGKAITTKLLSLARADVVDLRSVDPQTVANDVVAIVSRMERFKSRNIEIVRHEPQHVLADCTLMTQVMLNLVVNALEATPEKEQHVRMVVSGGTVEVIDEGRGLSADEMARVFEPFYTSKRGASQAHEAHGLGLSISHAIVQRMGGTLSVASDGPGHGCRFILQLPRASA